MTGIMAAVSGVSPNVIYAAGLYGPAGPQAFTITSSGTSQGGSSVSINYTWIGYLRPASTGTNTITISSVWDQFTGSRTGTRNADWGDSPSSVSYVWVGTNAIAGNTGNANQVSNNNTTTYSPSLIAGVYYPIRYTWQTYLPYNAFAYYDGFFDQYYPGWTTSNCSISVGNGSGFYNTKTNGF
jgi:hypothetical protein